MRRVVTSPQTNATELVKQQRMNQRPKTMKPSSPLVSYPLTYPFLCWSIHRRLVTTNLRRISTIYHGRWSLPPLCSHDVCWRIVVPLRNPSPGRVLVATIRRFTLRSSSIKQKHPGADMGQRKHGQTFG